MATIVLLYYLMKGLFFFSLVRTLVKFEVMERYYFLLAVIYTAGIAFLSYVFLLSPLDNPDIRAWQIWLAKTFGIVTVYFWFLTRFDAGIIFWILLVLGLGIIWY